MLAVTLAITLLKYTKSTRITYVQMIPQWPKKDNVYSIPELRDLHGTLNLNKLIELVESLRFEHFLTLSYKELLKLFKLLESQHMSGSPETLQISQLLKSLELLELQHISPVSKSWYSQYRSTYSNHSNYSYLDTQNPKTLKVD
jgi:hypothetical protein